jgi:hypothetical protein
LPLVTGGAEGATPFIEIPSSREGTVQEAGTAEQGSNGTATSTPTTAAAAAGNSTQAAR